MPFMSPQKTLTDRRNPKHRCQMGKIPSASPFFDSL